MKLTENSTISVQLVVVLIGVVIWLVRLGEHCDHHEKLIAELNHRIYRLEHLLQVEADDE